VRTGLPPEQRVDSPAAVDPPLDSGGVEPVEYLEDVRCLRRLVPLSFGDRMGEARLRERDRPAGDEPRNDLHRESARLDGWVSFRELTRMLRVNAEETQTAVLPVVQRPRSEEMAGFVQLGEMCEMRVLQLVRFPLVVVRRIISQNQEADREAVELHEGMLVMGR
jgi:hypothetical protein